MKHDLCPQAVSRCRWLLVKLNSPVEDFVVGRTLAQSWIVDAVMRTREGLDRAKVARMVNALWECEG